MKIISWNVNGIRAWSKKGTLKWLNKENPEVFCVQETKAHPDQLEKDFPILFNLPGYHSYFNAAEVRKGYSGVAVYSKIKPQKVTYGLGIKKLDQEGRQINIYYKKYLLINCYFPNGGKSPEHFKYKLEYYNQFINFIKKNRKDGYKIIFCGDLNVAHNEIDLERHKENKKSIGFLPIEREKIDKIMKEEFIDVYRYLNPESVRYTWWDMKTRARERNVGWRIDYFFISKEIFKKVKNSDILDKVQGSDHCPIVLDIDINLK